MLKDSSVFIFRVKQYCCLTLKLKTLESFNMLGSVYPVVQHNMVEALNQHIFLTSAVEIVSVGCVNQN